MIIFLFIVTYSKVQFDLQAGYDTFIAKDWTTNGYLDHLLKWIQLNPSKISLALDKEQTVKRNNMYGYFKNVPNFSI